MPLYLLINLLPAWLRTEGVDLKTIGLFTLTGAAYIWKFLWSPLLDRYALPWLGRRRGWMAAMQAALLVSIAALGFLQPRIDIWTIAYLSIAIAFFSASFDIAADAYRRELLPEVEFGLGNSIYVNAYRISSLVPGSLALILADRMPWSSVFVITALFMLPGHRDDAGGERTAALRARTAHVAGGRRRCHSSNSSGARVGSEALLILAFIFFYKLGDSMATALATPFYLDLGFTKTQIGVVAKNAGLWASIVGGMLGGLWMVKIGINRGLWLFGVVQMMSILGFAWLARLGQPDIVVLGVVIALEALGVGLGTVAFVAFIARATDPRYTATQFALLTSLSAVPRTVVNASTGWIVDETGWFNFFLICTLLALPGMALLLRVAPWHDPATEGARP